MLYGHVTTIKSTSDQDNKAKTVVLQGEDGRLVITQLFLIDRKDLLSFLEGEGCDCMKFFKDKVLVERCIAMKGDTFSSIIKAMMEKGILKIN
jgi:hypothetical protein